MKGVPHCSPIGSCDECVRVRAMSREEFTDWISERLQRPRCATHPEHLIGSYAHRVEYQEAE